MLATDFIQKTKNPDIYYVGFSIAFGQIMKYRPYTKKNGLQIGLCYTITEDVIDGLSSQMT